MVLELVLNFLPRVAEVDFVIKEFMNGDQRGFGKTFVELGDLNLFTVFEYFLQAVVVGGELFNLLVEFFLHL